MKCEFVILNLDYKIYKFPPIHVKQTKFVK